MALTAIPLASDFVTKRMTGFVVTTCRQDDGSYTITCLDYFETELFGELTVINDFLVDKSFSTGRKTLVSV